ncbi:hypothetical protein [Heliomicrobium modesticaldum]|nr:hypothetical protein [Heliomicrobium modesticaldum]
MEEWVLQPGEKPYRILTAAGDSSPDGLKGIHFYSKIKETGMIDCLLIFSYDERQAVRQAKDFPPDQFEHFLRGVASRSPYPCQIVDGIREEQKALALWESFIGPSVEKAVS